MCGGGRGPPISHRTSKRAGPSSCSPRRCCCSCPCRAVFGAIAYLPLSGGKFLFLATITDLCSRRLAGWAITDSMRAERAIDALAAAERCPGSLSGAVMHTDHLNPPPRAWDWVTTPRP
ncbi:DDE-type integrase/transposase/recombinase [Streptomyces sp. NPDC086549]|uniref:DDE-type integrase/transposase/recombinase n=1 Tax=Streptomyces sp. NPDC086549 TaxID=3365752 RepID=UPI00382EC33E